jgi:preprotein translocase subunit SecA
MLTYIKKLFGSKSDRDIKEVTPLLASIHKAYETISKLSTDELRAKTHEFKSRIEAYISTESTEIIELKEKIDSEDLEEIINVDEKERLYQQID